tara:strand:+ start:651 stop:1445 length:795 start_codon:yes stop_codon:yes gene_type:complete
MATPNTLQINDLRLKRMFQRLRQKTGASYDDVISGVTSNILTAAARGTRSEDLEGISESLKSMLRQPFRITGGGKVGVTKNDKVWYQGAGWGYRNWILCNSNGELEAPQGRVMRSNGTMSTVSPSTRADIVSAMAEVRQTVNRQRNYATRTIGLGRASWVEMMRRLNMTYPGGAKIAQAAAVDVPQVVHSAIVATKRGTNSTFNIRLENRVQSALNNKARGIGAFTSAVNRNSRNFERKIGQDLDKYVRKFARQNGFQIRGSMP